MDYIPRTGTVYTFLFGAVAAAAVTAALVDVDSERVIPEETGIELMLCRVGSNQNVPTFRALEEVDGEQVHRLYTMKEYGTMVPFPVPRNGRVRTTFSGGCK